MNEDDTFRRLTRCDYKEIDLMPFLDNRDYVSILNVSFEEDHLRLCNLPKVKEYLISKGWTPEDYNRAVIRKHSDRR